MSTETSATPRLTRAAVLRAALDLVDESGLRGLTMRNLGQRLGVVPMAVYRHVKDKDDLLDGVLDEAVARVRLPAPHLPWREALAALAHAIRAALREHPNLVGPLVGRPSLGPASIEIGEYGFSVLRSAGFRDADIERALNLVLVYTLGFTVFEVPRAASSNGGRDLDAAYSAEVLDRYPHTAAIAPRAANLVGDEQFDFGLERVLDGIAGLHPTGSV